MSKESKDAEESGEIAKRQPPKKRAKKGAKDKDDGKVEIRAVEEEQIEEEPIAEEKITEPPKKKGKKAPSRKEKAAEMENVAEDVTSEKTEEKSARNAKPPPIKKQAKKATPVKKGKKATNEKEISDEPPSEEGTDDDNDGNAVVKKKKSKGKIKDHPSTIDMITEAINYLNDSHGSSVKAIKSFILENYKVREDLIKHMMKNAFTIALKRNILARPKGQTDNERLSHQILVGSYIINANNEEDALKNAKPRARPASLRQFSSTGKVKAAGKKKKRKKRTSY